MERPVLIKHCRCRYRRTEPCCELSEKDQCESFFGGQCEHLVSK